MTDYELGVMQDTANDLYKAVKILTDVDHNMGYILSVHYPVILGCKDILSAIAEDLYSRSKEQSHD